MIIERQPIPGLRPFVSKVWASDQIENNTATGRTRVLPSVGMRLVIRLNDNPLTTFESEDAACGKSSSFETIGGPRSSFYLRDVSKPIKTVGAELLPGATKVLFGVHAQELAEEHTPLDAVWGSNAHRIREQLINTDGLSNQLDVFEKILTSHFPRVVGINPAVALALERFPMGHTVQQVVDESGYSHRRFIELFKRSLGFTPSLFCRIVRFNNAFKMVKDDSGASFVQIALESGYSDQAHFSREFRDFAGISPSTLRQPKPLPSSIPLH